MMNNVIQRLVISIAFLIGCASAFAQEAPTGLIACLDGNGTLFNVAPGGEPREACPQGAITVRLGSLSNIDVGDSLTSKVEGGNAFLDISPGFAVPPVCPPGQIALSDDNGGWVCTPPNLAGRGNPASKVWVVPEIGRCVNGSSEGNGRPRAIVFCEDSPNFTEVIIVNPGADPASVSCYFFDRNGALQLDLIQSRSLGSGARNSCFSPLLDSGSSRTYAWALVVSDQPVLPTAKSFWLNFLGKKNATHSAQIEAYAVDCNDPDGHEFVCQFAR